MAQDPQAFICVNEHSGWIWLGLGTRCTIIRILSRIRDEKLAEMAVIPWNSSP